MVAAWCIWNEHNAFVFYGNVSSLSNWKAPSRGRFFFFTDQIKKEFHDSILLCLVKLLGVLVLFSFSLSLVSSSFLCV